MKLEAAVSALSDSREKPNGELRVTTAVGLGSYWLSPRIGEFLELYPEISLQLAFRMKNSIFPCVGGRGDPLAAAGSIGSHAAKTVYRAFPRYASPGYLKKWPSDFA